MKRYGYSDWETKAITFDEQSYDTLYREILDAKVRQGDAQDLARFKRKINITGHLASAATTFAAISDENGLLSPRSKLAVCIHLTFNQDGVSLLQKDDKKRKSLRSTKKARNVSRSTGFSMKSLTASAKVGLDVVKKNEKKKGPTETGQNIMVNINSVVELDASRDSL